MEFFLVNLVWILTSTLLSIVGFTVCKKFYSNVKSQEKQEKGQIIQKLLKTYAAVQCIGWPLLNIVVWSLFVNKTRINALGLGFMQAGIVFVRVLWRTLRNYIGFNSFIIALCRYLFIVKDSMILEVGLRKCRNILLSSSVAVPVFLSLVGEATTPIEHGYFCVFVPQSIKTYEFDNNTDPFCSQDVITKVFESPFYAFFWENLPLSINYGMMVLRLILVIVVHSNVFEGIMYLHIYLFYWR